MIPVIPAIGAFFIWLLALKASGEWRGMRMFCLLLGIIWYGFLAASYLFDSANPTERISPYPLSVISVVVSVGLVMCLIPAMAVLALRDSRRGETGGASPVK